jgi:hypothetical protein
LSVLAELRSEVLESDALDELFDEEADELGVDDDSGVDSDSGFDEEVEVGLGDDDGVAVGVAVGVALGVALGDAVSAACGGGASWRVAPLLALASPRLTRTKINKARRTSTRLSQYVRAGSGPSGWSTPLITRA